MMKTSELDPVIGDAPAHIHNLTVKLVNSSRARGASADAWLERIDTLTSIMEAAEVARARAVEHARSNGHSWAQIGQQIGMSKQAAQQKYGKKKSTPVDADQLTIDGDDE